MQTRDRLYTPGQLARRLGLKAAWIKSEADANRLPCVRVGDGYLFDVHAVEAALLERAGRVPGDGKDGAK
jgi:hypothetical protein